MASRRRVLLSSGLIRSRAFNRGILGPSRFWRAVAVGLFGREVLRRVLRKNPEQLGTEKLKPGQLVRIEAIAPPSRRQRRGTRRRTA